MICLRNRHVPAQLKINRSDCEDPPLIVTNLECKIDDMKMPRFRSIMGQNFWVLFLLIAAAGVLRAQTAPASMSQGSKASKSAQDPLDLVDCDQQAVGSPYIPVDSWIYPEVWRLYSLGFVDHVFLNIRPWTRHVLAEIVDDADARLSDAGDGPAVDEAQSIYKSLKEEIDRDRPDQCASSTGKIRIESVYSMVRGISGTPLRDSFHLGSTIVNDYGRPYESGISNYTGLSGYATAGRFTLYARGEFQGAQAGTGYSSSLAKTLSAIDLTNAVNPVNGVSTYYSQSTIPLGPIASTSRGRILEAYVSADFKNHIISFGKHDQWLGPAQGASFAYSNNAENIYAFEINRIEPLYVPLLSKLTGPFRYEFLVGSLQGHSYIPNPAFTGDTTVQPNVINPGNPWVHLEKISFKPTKNLELGFERTAIWGGKGHGPITLHSFLKSFFSLQNVTAAEKFGRGDPGARFGAFDFSYRLPFVRNWLTLYSDGEVHDDVSPIDAPRRAAWRPGLYLSHFPGIPKLDMRAEVAWTDPPVDRSVSGQFMYWEFLQRQGYTNNGQIFGDWIGREAKGGQGWMTYHLSGNEWIGVSIRGQKAPKDFIPGGTTINEMNFEVVKRFGSELELRGNLAFESWRVPVYMSGKRNVTATTVQLTWYPRREISF